MNIAFFVSSVGDTNLAKKTIEKLLVKDEKIKISVIPLTLISQKNIEVLKDNKKIKIFDFDQNKSNESQKSECFDLEFFNKIIKIDEIDKAFIGVPSAVDEELAFKIACKLTIPYVLVNEHMFTPSKNHKIWNYLTDLTKKDNCTVVVPLEQAQKEILSINSKANCLVNGHLSLDNISQTTNVNLLKAIELEKNQVKQNLGVSEKEELIFVSGTTQPLDIDLDFLAILLNELSTGKYPQLHLRFGLHPGVANMQVYVDALLKLCSQYEKVSSQFKIIISEKQKTTLNGELLSNFSSFLVCADVPGPKACIAADKIAQAVPGASINEAAFQGKPVFYDIKNGKSYLPVEWFCSSQISFFKSESVNVQPHKKQELGLEEFSADEKMCEFLLK